MKMTTKIRIPREVKKRIVDDLLEGDYPSIRQMMYEVIRTVEMYLDKSKDDLH